MTHKSLVVLVILNVVLLVGLLLVGGPQPTAKAQFAGSPIFQMIAAETGVNDRDVIYLFEANSGELRAFQFSSADDRLVPIGRRNLGQDVNRRDTGR